MDTLKIEDNYWLYCDDNDDGFKGTFSICGKSRWDYDQYSYPFDVANFSIFVGEPSYYGIDSCTEPQNVISNEKQNIEIEREAEKSGNFFFVCFVLPLSSACYSLFV